MKMPITMQAMPPPEIKVTGSPSNTIANVLDNNGPTPRATGYTTVRSCFWYPRCSVSE